jgi:hypothetical protein
LGVTIGARIEDARIEDAAGVAGVDAGDGELGATTGAAGWSRRARSNPALTMTANTTSGAARSRIGGLRAVVIRPDSHRRDQPTC